MKADQSANLPFELESPSVHLSANLSVNKMHNVCRYLGQRQLYEHREEVDNTESETMVSLLRFQDAAVVTDAYLIFVISFTPAVFSNSKFYTRNFTKNTPKR